jgi:hypothetical protein
MWLIKQYTDNKGCKLLIASVFITDSAKIKFTDFIFIGHIAERFPEQFTPVLTKSTKILFCKMKLLTGLLPTSS